MRDGNRGDAGEGCVTEVEVGLSDPSYPFVEASAVEQCRVVLEELVPLPGSDYLEFFSVTGAPGSAVREVTAEHDGVEVRLVDEYDGGGILRFDVSRGCPAVTLADEGAIPRHLAAEEGEGRIVVDVLPSHEASAVLDRFREQHPAAEVVAKRERPVTAPTFSQRQLQRTLDDALTDRQWDVLRAAYRGGYYDDPRETTGEELAERLDIAPSTYLKHLRAAEQEMVSLLLAQRLDGTPPRGGE